MKNFIKYFIVSLCLTFGILTQAASTQKPLQLWKDNRVKAGLPVWKGAINTKVKSTKVSIKPDLILMNNKKNVALFSSNGALLGLTDIKYGYDFIHAKNMKLVWLIQLKLDNGNYKYLYSPDWSKPKIKIIKNGLIFIWNNVNGNLKVENIWRLTKSGLRGRMRIKGTGKDSGINEVRFPIVRKIGTKSVSDVCLPFRNWGTLLRNFKGRLDYSYPSCNWPMQFIGLTENNNSLYLGVEDGGAERKRLAFSCGKSFTILLYPKNMGISGKGFDPGYDIVFKPLHGNWLAIAKRYREWALKQKWCSKGPLIKRDDIPKRLRDGLFWLKFDITPPNSFTKASDFVIQESLKARRIFGDLPIANHHYSWHQIPFDNDYPHYKPAKTEFKKVVDKEQEVGITAMPYINGRLWDSDTADFKTHGIKGACKNKKSECYIENYGSGEDLVPMCPYTKVWQDKMFEVVSWLFNDLGVEAVYMDQIASATPCLCMDPKHGHPIGGGKFWVDGYRKLLNRIQQLTQNTQRFIATEDTAEPYIDVIDAFLMWESRSPNDTPIYAAVYSDMSITFASQASYKETPTAFAMKVGRDFLWGGQLGWFRDWILLPKFKKQCDYTKYLVKSRLALKDFFSYGEYLGPAKIDNSTILDETWITRTKKSIKAQLPAVMGSLWKSYQGEKAIIIVNFDKVPHVVDVKIPNKWGKQEILSSDTLANSQLSKVPNDGEKCRILIPSRKARIIYFRDSSKKQNIVKLANREVISGSTIGGHIVADVKSAQGMLINGKAFEVLAPQTIRVVINKPLRSLESVECLVDYRLSAKDKACKIKLKFPKNITVLPSPVISTDPNKLSGQAKLILTAGKKLKAGTYNYSVNVNGRVQTLKLLATKARLTMVQSKSEAVKVDGLLNEWKNAKWIKLDHKKHNRIPRSKWKNVNDLSGKAAVRVHNGMFYMAFVVTDDIHHKPEYNQNIWQGDCVQISIDPLIDSGEKNDDNDIRFAAAITSKGPKLYFWSTRPYESKVAINRTDKQTFYEIALPLEFVMTGSNKKSSKPPIKLNKNIGFSFTLNESDARGKFEGWLEWTPGICGGINPQKYGLILAEK